MRTLQLPQPGETYVLESLYDGWGSLLFTKPQITYLVQGIAELSRRDCMYVLVTSPVVQSRSPCETVREPLTLFAFRKGLHDANIKTAIREKLRWLPVSKQEAFKKWFHPQSPDISNEAGKGGEGGQLEDAA